MNQQISVPNIKHNLFWFLVSLKWFSALHQGQLFPGFARSIVSVQLTVSEVEFCSEFYSTLQYCLDYQFCVTCPVSLFF